MVVVVDVRSGYWSMMGIDDSRIDPAMRRRAARRVRLLFVVAALLVGSSLVAGFVLAASRSGGRHLSPWLPVLIITGLLAVPAAVAGVFAWVIRRRGVSVVSPLWGVDSATRKRVMHAIKHREELTGQDRELALSEAYRSRRLAPVTAIVLPVLAALLLTGTALSLASHTDWMRVAPPVFHLGLLGLLAAYQRVFYLRASAYLDRFGSPPTITTSDR